MTSTTSADRERRCREQAIAEGQRFEHLVLGRHRPKPSVKASKRRKARPIALAPGIEERVQLRERWSHKQGTPETHEHLDQVQRRPGSLARLYATDAIDKDQLAAAQQIAEAYRAITADVAVRTASFETRLDGSRHGLIEGERIGRVHADLAYSWWRDAVGGCVDALLAVIVHDVGLTIVAREGGISMPRARRMLTDALDLWPMARRRTSSSAAAIAG